MSEIKPVIKTAEQRFNEDCEAMNLICVNDINQMPYFKAEVAELRAALEALQAENASQAKRIAELEEKLKYCTNTAC